MHSILEAIIENKRAELSAAKPGTSIEQFKERIAGLGRCRNFYRAVTKRNPRAINVIAEVKKASPSAGIIRSDFDPVEIAKIYRDCGADAISVLTDEKYFHGRLEYINQVKEAVELPVLRKDFIIDPWQIYESRAAGADAILLIAETLKPGELMDMLITAAELTLTVLLEVHEADSLLAVRSLIDFPKSGAVVLGINNRDLKTMKVDLKTTARLIELLDGDKPVVTESGIRNHRDVNRMKKLGVSAILIGQSLCESPDIVGKFKELF